MAGAVLVVQSVLVLQGRKVICFRLMEASCFYLGLDNFSLFSITDFVFKNACFYAYFTLI